MEIKEKYVYLASYLYCISKLLLNIVLFYYFWRDEFKNSSLVIINTLFDMLFFGYLSTILIECYISPDNGGWYIATHYDASDKMRFSLLTIFHIGIILIIYVNNYAITYLYLSSYANILLFKFIFCCLFGKWLVSNLIRVYEHTFT